MEIRIEKKYISKDSPYRKDSCLCHIHKQLDDIELDPHKLIQFVHTFVKEKNSYPVYLKSFDDFYTKPLLYIVPDHILTGFNQSIITKIIDKCCASYLISKLGEYIITGDTITFDFETEIKKIFEKILYATITDNISCLDSINKLLSRTIKKFALSYPDCACSHILLIDRRSMKAYNTQYRIDLVYKEITDTDFKNCENVDKYIKSVIISINNNLKESSRYIMAKPLKDIPKYLWTQIFFEYLSMGHDNSSVLVDEDNKCVLTEFPRTFLYPGEPNLGPLYRIPIYNEAYCILCDAISHTDRKIRIGGDKKIDIFNKKYRSPYICKNICSKLILIHSDKYQLEIFNGRDILKLRHVKNRVMLLYCSLMDSHSSFQILPKDVIKKIISDYWTNVITQQIII